MDCLFNRRKEKMMKKLFIMILVLGISSAANAVLIEVDGQIADAVDIGETATITVVSEDTSSWLGYILVEPGNPGALSDITALDAAGNMASFVPYDADDGIGYEVTVAMNPVAPGPAIAVGPQFTMTFSGALIDETSTISLYAGPDYTIPTTSVAVTVVPEPMTILLLGLGGLFLRRRK
jgi:hypothetical protein